MLKITAQQYVCQSELIALINFSLFGLTLMLILLTDYNNQMSRQGTDTVKAVRLLIRQSRAGSV